MLVLTRERNETIVIDGRITITINSIIGGRVRVGIDAPKEMPIVRGEVLAQATAAAEAGDDHHLRDLIRGRMS